MAVDAAQIASLLQQSKAAHDRYKDNKPRMVSNGAGGVVAVPGNPTAAREALIEAARLRAQAHELDHTHSVLAWQQEPMHSALTEFYVNEMVAYGL